MRTAIHSAALLLLGISAAYAQAVEMVVLESNSPRYAAGQTLDATARISLAAGEFVEIVTEDARFVRVEGPHDGPATGSAPDDRAVRRALDALIIRAERARVGGTGGVRGDLESETQQRDTRPDPWLLHAQRGGDQCVLRGQNVSLWREDATGSAVAELVASPDDPLVHIRWADGEQRATWPAEIPLTEDFTYEVRRRGSQQSIPIRLHLLAAAIVDNDLAAAAWLAARGCTDQVRLLSR